MFQLPACDGMFFPKMLPGHLAGSDGSDHPSLPLLLLHGSQTLKCWRVSSKPKVIVEMDNRWIIMMVNDG
jgi:hypothetical protein